MNEGGHQGGRELLGSVAFPVAGPFCSSVRGKVLTTLFSLKNPETKNNLEELGLSFHHVLGTQVFGLGNKHLSHPTKFLFYIHYPMQDGVIGAQHGPQTLCCSPA